MITAEWDSDARSKVGGAFRRWADGTTVALATANLKTANEVTRSAKEGFTSDHGGDSRASGLSRATPPVPPYRATSDLVPHVRTGTLRRSIAFRPAGPALVHYVEAFAKYAKFVEFGTARSRPHPFLFPAAEGERKAHEARIAAALVRRSAKP